MRPSSLVGGALIAATHEITRGERTFTYYTKADAEAEGLDFRQDWRKADKGDFVLTDTGFVVPVIGVYDYTHRQTGQPYRVVRIPTGMFWGHPGRKMDHHPREDPNTWSGKKPRYDDPDRRPTKLEQRFAKFVVYYIFARDPEPEISAYRMVSRANPQSKVFRRNAREIARRANVVKLLGQELESKLANALEEKEITIPWLLDQMKALVDKEGGSDHVKRQVLKDFAEMLGIKSEYGVVLPPGRALPQGHGASDVQKLLNSQGRDVGDESGS